MISFLAGGGKFQMRAAAIVRRDGFLLIHNAVGESWCTLPGGRVEFSESAAETVAREIGEEMGCGAEVGPLRFVVENLFALDQTEVHELGFYFDVALTSDFPFSAAGVCHRSVDGGTELEFRWVRLDTATLRSWNFAPPILADRIPFAGSFEHIVERQR
jgi:8-oxo-dGTP pyrophosphatase MutT (NUDIX family)